MAYKGMMLSGMPNMAFTFGYTNASWTLKADLVSEFVCRVLNYMDANGFDTVEPQHPGNAIDERPFMDFTPGLRPAALGPPARSPGRGPRGGSSRTTCSTAADPARQGRRRGLLFTKHRASVTI